MYKPESQSAEAMEVARLFNICDYVGYPREIAFMELQAMCQVNRHLSVVENLRMLREDIFMTSPIAN